MFNFKELVRNHSAELTVMAIGLVLSIGLTFVLGTGDVTAGAHRRH